MNDENLIAAADAFGTPLYVFDEASLRDRVALLEETLPARAALCFAVKANPLAIPLISPYVHRFEVCSPGELRICQNVGVDPAEIVLSGVAKDEDLIRGLLDAGAAVHRYTVESRRQFDLLLALARAFVIEPGVLLMDEPLSNLDAKLRVQMRTTIKKLQRRLGITTIYVTHDQEEALAISDRIAVMKEGNIMQIGRPEEIYRKPANPFVANFIGVSNFVDCTVDGQDPKAASVKLHDGYSFQMPLRAPYSGEVILSARPEQLFFSEKGIPGKVNLSVFLGDFIQYEVQLHTGQVLELNEYTKDVDSAKADGEEVHISFNPKQVSLYRKDTEEVLSC